MTSQLPPLQPTTACWFNRVRLVRSGIWAGQERWRKVLAHYGSYEQFAYGTHTEATREWRRDHRREWRLRLQDAIICSPWSGVLAWDVDDPEEFARTRTGQLIGRQHAHTTRGDHFHILGDARLVQPSDWPVQDKIDSADHIKSCGFVPWPGSEHYTGQTYEPTDLWRSGQLLIVSPRLIAATNADLADQKRRRREAGIGGGGGGSGGTGGGHDGELAGQVLSMVLRGLTKEQCWAEWRKIAIPRDPGWPFEREDFERHYRSALRKAQEIREQEDQMAQSALWMGEAR